MQFWGLGAQIYGASSARHMPSHSTQDTKGSDKCEVFKDKESNCIVFVTDFAPHCWKSMEDSSCRDPEKSGDGNDLQDAVFVAVFSCEDVLKVGSQVLRVVLDRRVFLYANGNPSQDTEEAQEYPPNQLSRRLQFEQLCGEKPISSFLHEWLQLVNTFPPSV